MKVIIKDSDKKGKKLMAIFTDDNNKKKLFTLVPRVWMIIQ